MNPAIQIIGGVRATVFLLLFTVATIFGGWNYWRKNVYYDALHLTAARKVQDARIFEQAQREALSDQATDLQQKRDERNESLQAQLDEIASRPPAERIVYKLQNRWLPATCPATPGSDGDATSYGGLQVEDEQFLVRFADEADDVVDQLTACQAAVDELLRTP